MNICICKEFNGQYGPSSDKFPQLCTIEADLSELCNESTLVSDSSLGIFFLSRVTRRYWRVEFDINIKLGTTELDAYVTWTVDVSSLIEYDCQIYK